MASGARAFVQIGPGATRAHRQQQLEGATTASAGTLMVSSSTLNSAVTVKAAPCSPAPAR